MTSHWNYKPKMVQEYAVFSNYDEIEAKAESEDMAFAEVSVQTVSRSIPKWKQSKTSPPKK